MTDTWGENDAVENSSVPGNDWGADDEVEGDGAFIRGFKKANDKLAISANLAVQDPAGAAQSVATADTYAKNNQGMPEGAELMGAWDRGDGISGGISEVAGEIGKDWGEARGLGDKFKSVGTNARAMGEGIAEQTGNMVAPVAGMIAGTVAGAKIGAPVGAAIGAPFGGAGAGPGAAIGGTVGGVLGGWGGASIGTAAIEGGGMTQQALMEAGIDPQDTEAVTAYLGEHGNSILKTAGVKGAIIGAVDTATMRLGGKMLNAPARAAADRAIAALGIDATDDAAVKLATKSDAFKSLIADDAAYQASKTGAGNIARNTTVAAMEPAGEFAGEYLGEGIAKDNWDTKNAALEAFSSVGQSGVMYAGQKAYQGLTKPLQAQVQPTPTPENPAPAPVDRPDPSNGPLSAAAFLLPAPAERLGLPNPGATLYGDADGNLSPDGAARDVDREYRPTGREKGPRTFGAGMDQQAARGAQPGREGDYIPASRFAGQPRIGETFDGQLAPEPAGLAAPQRRLADGRPDAGFIETNAAGESRQAKASNVPPKDYVPQGGRGMDQQTPIGKQYSNVLAAKNAIQKAGAASTHEAVQVGPKRFEVRPIAAIKQSEPKPLSVEPVTAQAPAIQFADGQQWQHQGRTYNVSKVQADGRAHVSTPSGSQAFVIRPEQAAAEGWTQDAEAQPAAEVTATAENRTAITAQQPKPKAPARKVDRERDSVLHAAIRLGGITTSYRQDTTGEAKGNTNIPGVGSLWSDKTGTSIDDMASLLDQHGYIPQSEMANDGGVSWLQAALGDQLAGRKEHFAPGSKRQEEQALKIEADRAAARAAQYTDRDAEIDALIDANFDLADDTEAAEKRRIATEKFAAELDELFGESNEPASTQESVTGAEQGNDQATGADQSVDRRDGSEQRDQGEGVAAAGSTDSAPAFDLAAQTEASAAADAKAQDERNKADAAAQRKADEAKKKADDLAYIKQQSQATADNFTLGQNAEDSVTGQGGMFDSTPSLTELGGKPAVKAESRSPIGQNDDIPDSSIIEDSRGKQYRVHYQRGNLVQAHPIVDGKAEVNSESGVRFHVGDPASADGRRTDPIFLVSKPEAASAAAKPAPAAAIISELGTVISEQKSIAEDWESRTYKRNNTQVDLQGDGPRSQGSISVSAANESRRENAIRAAKQAEKAARTLKLNLENDYQGAMAPLVKMRGKVETDADFEQQLLSDMGVRPPGGKGNVSTNSLSKAVLRGVKVEQAKAEQAKQAEQDEAADAERKRQDAEGVRQQAVADGVDEVEALFGATATTDTHAQRLREALPDATLRSGDTASSNPRSPLKGKWAVFQGDTMLSSGWAGTREAAVDGVLNKAEAWHTPLPEQGIALTKEQQADKDGAYRGVTALIAADAMDAVTQTQSINQQAMSLYYLPNTDGRNGAARLIPDGQAMPANWKKVDAPALSVGAMTREQAVRKITDLLANAAVVGSPAKAEAKTKTTSPAKIENFGEELKGGRSRVPKSLDAELTDEDIAAQPLSKLWPPAEIDGMEDTFAAAVAMAARSEIPAKPRKGYKLNSWVSKVKTLRGLAKFAAQSREGFIAKLKEFDGLAGFSAKVELLELIDRANWKRIGKVSEHPTAYRMEDGKKVTSPFVAIEIDDKRNQFGDAKTVGDALDAVNKLLGNEATGKVMAFEIRKDRTTHQYSINKTGDKEYRVLKEFATLTEARDFMRNNNADLVAAWGGVKDRDNVKKTDVRNAENRPRTGADHRKGKDVTPEMFVDTLGFRGVEFGNWVGQGANTKERQGMLNAAFDALVDLASIIGVQPKAISLNGTLGLAFGSRGKGNAAAHFEPGNLVINLTKTKGAGTLAHEWFHALDNYFARERGGEVPIKAGTNPQLAYRQQNFITYRPEPLYVHKTKHRGEPISKAKLEHYGKNAGPDGYYHPSNWHLDPTHPKGVRPVVETAFADLVKALEDSPMAKRASANDKGPDGYWGRIIERGARAFENFTISKMQEQGYSNDYLANVVEPSNFPRSADRYPYLLPEEMAPITEAFDRLFGTLESKEDGAGNVALFSRVSGATRDGVFLDRGAVQKAAIEAVGDVAMGFVYSSYLSLPAEIKESAKAMDIPPHEIRAVHWNGTTYLVDGRFKSALDVERAVYHEHYAHFGMRAKYGAALGPQLRTLLEGVGGLDGLRQLAEQQNIDLSAYEKAIAKDDKTPEHLKPLILMDELLAHVAESGGTLKRLIQEYVGMLRAWLRRMGYKNMAGMGVTDLAAELRGARKAAQQASKNAGSADVRFMFAGAEAATADQYSLDEAAARLEKGESATRVRLETGWSKGADNKWRFEIADDEAGFTDAPIFESFEDFFNRKERENYGARVSPSQMKAAEFTRWKAYRNAVELEYNARNGRRNLGEMLDHPKLFAAYPDLAGVQVSFPRESDSRGSYYPRYDSIEVALSADPEQMLSTLLHEVQHAIQHREGFAMGGNSDRNFADAVKGAVQRMKQTTREQAAMWRITNQSAIKAAEQAAETARYGLLFESATRLMEHSRRDRPSGVFRNIRNEMQWLYDPMFKGNEKARDLQYAFYEIPKSHNMDKRNAFISKMAFDAGQLFMEQIPAETRAQFKADTRTMKGMLNALEREARNKRKELRPLDDLNASERAAQAVYDSTEYATSYDIYRALAGEAEARNTQTRQKMTDAERRAQSPASTLDVDASKLIVMFGGMDVHAPSVMASQVQPETIYIDSMFGDGTTRVLKNPTRNQALAFAKAAKHESMRGIVDPATGDLYLADSYAVDHKMLAEGVGLTWEDVRYGTDPETGSSNRLNIPANSVEFYPRPIFSGDQKNQSARYRLTPEASKGIPLFSARAIAKKVMAATGLNATVVNNESELPADLQAQIKRDKATGRVAGVYHNGTAYLVASNLRDTQHAISVMLHEAVGHGGVKSVLGSNIGPVMRSIYSGMPAAMRNELERRYAGQTAGLSAADAQVLIAEEYVAHLAEHDPSNSVLDRVVALVRKFIRELFGAEAAGKWSRGDIVQLLAEAKRAAATGKGPDGSRYRESSAAEALAALPDVSEADEAEFVASLGDGQARAFAGALYKARGTESPFFKSWFGKSRMIDKQGQPITFVHRSYGERDSFTDSDLGKNTGTPTAALGHYLARKDVGNVERYGPVVERFYIRMAKPKVVTQDQFQAMGDWSLAQVKAYRETLIGQGFDGMYVQGLAWPIVFEGKNIKAVRNAGTFDATASTRYSLAQTATAAFKRWFGDSKVREPMQNSKQRFEDMPPLAVYHSTDADFDAFTSGRETVNSTTFGDITTERHGVFFAENPKFAEGYGKGDGQRVMPVYLSIQNPIYLDEGISGEDLAAIVDNADGKIVARDFYGLPVDGMWQAFDGDFGKNFVDAAKTAGFDGAYMIESDPATGEAQNVWVAFEPEQIKSATGNNGDFDPSNPDIRYSLTGARDLFDRATGPTPLDRNDPFAAENRRLREDDKTLWAKAKKVFARQFAPGGLLPEAVFNEKITRDNEFQAVEFDVRHLSSTLGKAVKADYGVDIESLTPAQMKTLAEALSGRVDPSIPESTKVAIVAMRQYIDSLSGEYLSILQNQVEANMEGADQALIDKITGNLGAYVNRSYQAFDDPKWFKTVPTEVVNTARAYLASGYMEQGETAAEARRLADVTVNEMLKNGTAYDSMGAFIAEGKLGAKDLTVLIKRKEIAPEIRALLGEYMDPRLNFAKSATKMGRLVWNQRFLDRVLSFGMGTILFEGKNRPADATTQIAGEKSETYAPLNGLWTYPEVAQAFQDALGKEQMSDLYRTVVRLNGMVKYGKTILSPTTAMRNWQSAMFFSLANGHFDLTQMKKSWAALREQVTQNATGDDLTYLRKLKKLGVVYDTPYAGEMMALLQDARMDELLSSKSGTGLKWLRKANQFAQGFYSFGDDFWKIIGFENEKAGLLKAGIPLAEAEAMAAKRIRDTYPTYSMIGKAIQWLRRFPLVGTFVSFPSEIIRTSVNMLQLTAADLKSDNPGLRAIGRKRAAGIAMVSGGFYALAALTAAAAGVGDDEEEALRDLAAPWSKNSTFLYTGRDADGKLRYFDLSFLDPYGYWKRPLTAMMRDQPWEKAAASGLSDMLSPFFGADITAGAIFEVLANKKPTGGPVFNPDAGSVDQLQDIANHMRKALQPGFVSNAERLYLAGTESRREGSGQPYDMRDEMVSLLGWRASTLDTQTGLYYRSFDFTDALSNARKTLTRTLRSSNPVTDGEVRESKQAANAQYQQAFTEMGRLVSAAQAAGMTRAEVVQTLKTSGIAQANIMALVNGRVPPMQISLAAQAKAVKQARTMRDSEHAAEIARRFRLAREQ